MIIDELLLLSTDNLEGNDEDSDVEFGSLFYGFMFGITCLDTSNKVLAHVRDHCMIMNTTRALMLFRSCIESSRGSDLWVSAYDELVRVSDIRGHDNKQFFIGMSKEKSHFSRSSKGTAQGFGYLSKD